MQTTGAPGVRGPRASGSSGLAARFKRAVGFPWDGSVTAVASMPPFASLLDEGIFFAVFFGWFLSEILARVRAASLQGGAETRSRGDRGSRLLIGVSLYAAVAVAFAFGATGTAPLPQPVFYVGIAAMVLGIAVRQWAIATLGAFFSAHVRALEQHRIVRSGPYRLVRHPSYSGAMLILVGIGFAVLSWGAVLVLLAFASVAYGYRIRVEEAFLVRELGPEYAAYMRETKRLIPFLL